MPKVSQEYSKQQILRSKQFKTTDMYLLMALLADDKKYSLEEVKKLLKNEKEREII